MKAHALSDDGVGRNTDERMARARKIVLQAAIFLVSFLLLFSRRPDAILDAQFYAEDGARWYADAYHLGWRCLLIPEMGYLQTVSRLVAMLALLFPFALAPLVMNLCALVVQILPVNFFLSSRFSMVPLRYRLIGSLLYLAIPNSIEVHANTTNIQWHLALLAFLVLVASPPNSRGWRFFDFSALVLISIDSPLVFLLAPLAGALCWKRTNQYSRPHFVAVLPGTLLQMGTVLFSQSHARVVVQTGATVARLTGILGGQIFLSSVAGVRTFAQLFFFSDRGLLLFAEITAVVAGLAIAFYGFRSAPVGIKIFLIFAAGVLALVLSHPIAGPDPNFPQWEYLQIPGRSSRYYLFPILGFYTSLLLLARTGTPTVPRAVRYVAIGVLLLVPMGALRDWRYPAFANFRFQSFASEFERAKPGDTVTIPINPVGWEMQLVKH